jgi:PUA domain protein
MAKLNVKKRYSIRKSRLADLRKKLENEIGETAGTFLSGNVEIVETDSDFLIYLVNRKPAIMETDEWVFPTLMAVVDTPFETRKAVVDSGAVVFMAKGADLMRPGIVDLTGDIKEGRPFVIVEEKHGKPLAIAAALMDYVDIMASDKGKVAKNIHYVGDDLWNLEI